MLCNSYCMWLFLVYEVPRPLPDFVHYSIYGIWKANLIGIVLSCYFWIFEQPTRVKAVSSSNADISYFT
jgi:hypothetical protein